MPNVNTTASHAITATPGSAITFGGISIAGSITTAATGTDRGYIVNLVKASTPVASLPGGISITGSAVSASRGVYINDFNVAGVSIGKGALLDAASLAIHVVDGTVISGDVTNDGVITSNDGTIYLGNTTIATRVTGAFTNRGRIFGPLYAVATESQVAGGATNATGASIIGPISMAAVDFINNGDITNKASSSETDPSNVGTPSLSSVRDYTQSAGASLGIAVSGTTTAGTDFSRLNVNGDASVSGTLNVDVKVGFSAAVGTIIPGVVLATGTRTGNFTSVTDNTAEYQFKAIANGKAIDLCVGGPTLLSFTVGGTVSGLGSDTVVLQNNAGDDLTVSADGAFTFATTVETCSPYLVTIKTQPAGKVCTVTNGAGVMGAANVTNVTVACGSSTVTIGGSVSGLGTGKTVVLQNNAGDDLAVAANGAFTFATVINSGSAYAVTVKTQPADQFCEVVQGTGTATANVTGVSVRCFVTSNVYPTRGGPVRVSITGGTCAGFEEATVGFRDPVGAPASAGAFPYGVLGFTVKSCGPGGTVRITMLLPQPLPPNTRYWKQLPSGWVDWTDRVQILGDRIILVLTDGQEGDTNPNPGEISDPSGPAAPSEAFNVPSLSTWALVAMGLLLGFMGFRGAGRFAGAQRGLRR